MIQGAIYTNIKDAFGNPVLRVKFLEMGVVFPSKTQYTASVDSVLFEHKMDVFEEGKKGIPVIGFDLASKSHFNFGHDESDKSNLVNMIKEEAIVK